WVCSARGDPTCYPATSPSGCSRCSKSSTSSTAPSTSSSRPISATCFSRSTQSASSAGWTAMPDLPSHRPLPTSWSASIVGSDEPSFRNAGLRGGRLVIVGRILHGDNLVQVRRVLERPLTDHLAKLLPTQIARKEWHLAILPAGFSFHGSPYEQPGQYS